MNTSLDISAEDCQGWNKHDKRFFPRCIVKEDIKCDVEGNLQQNAREEVD